MKTYNTQAKKSYDNLYSPISADKTRIEQKRTKNNNNERKKENINTGQS